MCRCRLTELNCVRTKMRFRPECMQLDTGISMSRYFPAIGTAGLLRDLVSGNRRVPRPPPRISETTRGMTPLLRLCCGERPSIRAGDNHQHVPSLYLSHFIVHDRKDDGEMMAACRFLRRDKDAESRAGPGRGELDRRQRHGRTLELGEAPVHTVRA